MTDLQIKLRDRRAVTKEKGLSLAKAILNAITAGASPVGGLAAQYDEAFTEYRILNEILYELERAEKE